MAGMAHADAAKARRALPLLHPRRALVAWRVKGDGCAICSPCSRIRRQARKALVRASSRWGEALIATSFSTLAALSAPLLQRPSPYSLIGSA